MDAQIAEWQTRAEALKPLNLKAIEPSLLELDAHLTLRSHIVGYTLSDADTTVWSTLRSNRVAHAFIKQNLMPNLCRWFRYIEEAYVHMYDRRRNAIHKYRPKSVVQLAIPCRWNT